MHTDNKKSILVLAEGPAQASDDTSIIAKAKYFINCAESGKRFILSQHYNGSNRFLFVYITGMYQSK